MTVHQEVVPVKEHRVPLAAHAEQVAVGLFRDLPHGTARIHKTGVWVGFQKRVPLFPHQLHRIKGCHGKGVVQRTLQQSGVHRVLQRKLIPALDLIPAEKVHRSLKDVLCRAL